MPSEAKSLIMLCVGDMLISRQDPPSVFQHVRNLFSGADLVVGNLEAPIADSGTPIKKVKASSFKSDARQLAALESIGFSAVNLANNHMLDFGEDALFETIEHLDRAGIAHTGAGKTFTEAHHPAFIESDGCRVAILGYTAVYLQGWAAGEQSPGLAVLRGGTSYEPPPRFFEGPGRPAIVHSWIVPEDKEQVSVDIAAARKQADIVVCTFHWGVSGGVIKLAEYQTDLGHHAIDAGADLVFGHHPHAMQGIEVYRGQPIFYSLGNFTFARYNPGFSHELETMILRCRIEERQIRAVEFLPVRCDKELDPRPLGLHEGREIIELIKKRSSAFDTQFVEAGDAVRVVTKIN